MTPEDFIVKYKVGDCVRLISGGPIMTVQYTERPLRMEHIGVMWFSTKHELQRAEFQPELLLKWSASL
jgi:uncharacterized protein YodC (DUF2158 family)